MTKPVSKSAVAIGTLWLAMTLAAHPVGLLEPAANRIWSWLVIAGLDVAMTPLTADMYLMHDPEGAHYQRKPSFQRQEGGQWITAEWKDLGFYEIRVPVLLMVEVVSNRWRADGHVHGICWQLRQRWPRTEAFRIQLTPQRSSDSQFGLSTRWSCTEP